MKSTYQKQMFEYLFKKKITNFIGVPDSTLKQFIDNAIKSKKFIITTREEEAIGIAVGISLSGETPLVFMQNAGFANCISTITSLVEMYKIPIIFLIGWRGYKKNDAPEHRKLGKIQPKLIQCLDLRSKIVTDKNWRECCDWALKISKNNPCVLIIRRL